MAFRHQWKIYARGLTIFSFWLRANKTAAFLMQVYDRRHEFEGVVRDYYGGEGQSSRDTIAFIFLSPKSGTVLMSDQFTFDVFLCHSSKDKEVVRALAERLRKDGVRVWLDEWELKPGDSIPAKIDDGLERSRVLVLCMSSHAFGSDWAMLESQTFRFRDPINKERRFIPLRLDEAQVKGALAQFLYIKWLPGVRDQEYPKLLEACRLPTNGPGTESQPSTANINGTGDSFQPWVPSRNQQRRVFAGYLRDRLLELNRSMQWADGSYTDLEAEAESEGRRRIFLFGIWFNDFRAGVHREKSLTNAILKSRERLIAVEGPAGSGKTVALRHVALQLAEESLSGKSNQNLIGIYVNLKTLRRPNNEPINGSLIESHVRGYLNQKGYEDGVEPLVADELRRGRTEGSLIFLFDSFDELPDVLSATEANDTIRAYGTAIDQFIGGLGKVRAVVASRPFRGAKSLGWPAFRLLALTPERQRKLIGLSGLDSIPEKQLIGELANARLEIQILAQNPLFLRLLCEHIRAARPFPKNISELFEGFVERRFTSDAGRIRSIFAVEPVQLRKFAEQAAFAMNNRTDLGLSPSVSLLCEIISTECRESPITVQRMLEALVAFGFATISQESGSTLFAFGHRRLQEYFATCVVLSDPSRVPPAQLLLDGRWRETAVALLQTQEASRINLVFDEAERALDRFAAIAPPVRSNKGYRRRKTVIWFLWPDGSLHLLGLLQDGMSARTNVLPQSIRSSAAKLLLSALETGTVLDEKWAVEVAAVADEQTSDNIVSHAISSDFEIIRDAAFRQAAQLARLSTEMDRFVRRRILGLGMGTGLLRGRAGLFTHLRRLPDGQNYVVFAQAVTVASVCNLLLSLWPFLSACLLLPVLPSVIAAYGLVVGLTACGASWLFKQPWRDSGEWDVDDNLKNRLGWRYGLASAISLIALFTVCVHFNIDWWAIPLWLGFAATPEVFAAAVFEKGETLPIVGPWWSVCFRCILGLGFRQLRSEKPVRKPRKRILRKAWRILRKAWRSLKTPPPKDSLLHTELLKTVVDRVSIGIGVLIVIGLGLLVINGVSFAYDKIPEHGRKVFEDWCVKALIGLFGAGFAIAGVVRAYMWISDQLAYLGGAFGGKLDPEDLLRTLLGFHFPGNTVRFVRAVRRGRRSEPSTSAHEIAASLLLLAQGGTPTKWDWLPEDATLHIRIKRFTEEHRNRADLISELARLVEYLNPSRDSVANPRRTVDGNAAFRTGGTA